MKFTEGLGQQNIVAVVCNGDPATTGAPQVGADLLTLTVPVTTVLPKGPCVVSWKVSDQDGTPGGDGSFKFTVATEAPTTTAAPTATTTPPTSTGGSTTGSATTASSSSNNGVGDGPLGVVRLFSTMSVAVLFGSFVLIAMAWPEGVEYILTVRFLRITYYIAVASTVGSSSA